MKTKCFFLLLLGFCVAMMSACGDKQDNEQTPESSDVTEITEAPENTGIAEPTQTPEKTENTVEEETPVFPEKTGRCKAMNASGDDLCLCGEIEMAFKDAEHWACVDDIWICLEDKGCKVEDVSYPQWGYLGNKVPGKIPQMPASHAGYELQRKGKDVLELLYGQDFWTCVETKCLCGGVEIKTGEICIDETVQTSDGFLCGTTVCKMADTCRDGECWCGETPQTEKNVNDYKCQDGKPVCKNISGCDCNGVTCPASAVCDDNGCTCGNQKIENIQDASKYACINNLLVCISEDGCINGDLICPTNSIYMNGKCLCGDDTVAEVKESGYRCIDTGEENLIICGDINGCKCGDSLCPQNSACQNGQCLCGDKPFNEHHHGGYVCYDNCEDNRVICENQNGCDCDENVCPKGGICSHGQCLCGDVPIGKDYKGEFECVGNKAFCSDSNDCICSGSWCPKNAVCSEDKCLCGDTIVDKAYSNLSNRSDFICDPQVMYENDDEFSLYYVLSCKQDKGCVCGDGYTPKGGTCVNGRGYCYGSEIPASDLSGMNSGYACENGVPQPVCKNEKGCKCGDRRCPQNTACHDGKCAYQDISDLYAVTGNEIRGYKYYNYFTERGFSGHLNDCGGGQLFEEYTGEFGLNCKSDKGCRCGESKCLKGETCTDSGCLCGDKPHDSVLDEELGDYPSEYICLSDEVICDANDGCSCGDTYCPKGSKCTAEGCTCSNENLPKFNKETVKDYLCGEAYVAARFPKIKDLIEDDDAASFGLRCNASSCVCGDVKCPKNAVCSSSGCKCGDEIIHNDTSEDISRFICENDHLVCDDSLGCQCGEKHCLKTMYCQNGECLSFDEDDEDNDTDDEDNGTDDDTDEDDEYDHECDGLTGMTDHEPSFYSNGERIDNVRYCPNNCNFGNSFDNTCMNDKNDEDDDIHCDDKALCFNSECTDCEDFTCETVVESDFSYCPKVSGRWICLKHGGCYHNSRLYHYGDKIDLDNDNPDDETINLNNDDSDKCGDLPLASGYICSLNKQMCNDANGCSCGSKQCAQGDYCENNMCICGSISEVPGCICGNSPLEAGYRCLIDTQICNNTKGCTCNSSKQTNTCAYGDICESGRCICNLYESSPGCICGNEILKPGYRCDKGMGMQICNDYSNGCVCGSNKCGDGAYCVNGQCLCSEHSRVPGCLCGNEPLRSNYECINGRQQCVENFMRNGCACGSDICSHGDICENDQHICAEGRIDPGCICGNSPLKPGYRCIKGHQVCQIAEDSYFLDFYDTINRKLQTRTYTHQYVQSTIFDLWKNAGYQCACGNGYVFNGQTCVDDKPCTDCEHIGLEPNKPYFTGECNGKQISYMYHNSALLEITNNNSLSSLDDCIKRHECADAMDKIAKPNLCVCLSDMPTNSDDYYCNLISVNAGDDRLDKNINEHEYVYEFKGWYCSKEQCACGTETCQHGERCSEGHCIPSENRLDVLDYRGIKYTSTNYKNITYKSGYWYCNHIPISVNQFKNYHCIKGAVWQCKAESCQCGELTINKNSYCIWPNAVSGINNKQNLQQFSNSFNHIKNIGRIT